MSSLLRSKQHQSRWERIARAEQELKDLADYYLGRRPRKRARHEVWKQITDVLAHQHVKRYLEVSLKSIPEHSFRQARPGRPGPNTKYVKQTKPKWQITWELDEEAIAYDHKSDGMYPLLTNDRSLTAHQVLEAHKRQPTIEKRFKQTKTVFEIAPVLLKNEGRIEALFFLYFIALLVQALIERELRSAMELEGLENLPLYPEERATHRPTAEQILRLYALVERHRLWEDDRQVQLFEPQLTDLQKQVLSLLGVPEAAYCRGP
jgi:transposase